MKITIAHPSPWLSLQLSGTGLCEESGHRKDEGKKEEGGTPDRKETLDGQLWLT